ncbi:MAG: sigma-70 family RNA polymerase sigma factor [Planctomycetes bacterium]|nr:sigma-70 family RNA polymerase sigma factor [Planctomycetota bacterium]
MHDETRIDPEGVRPDGNEPEEARIDEDRALVEAFLDARESADGAAMEAAFRMLIVRHQDRIHKLVSGYTKDALEAEDVTQEVFVKVFNKIDGFQGDSAFFTWLYRIAVNTALDWTGKRKRRPVHLADDLGVLESRYDETETRRPPAPDAAMLLEERARVTRSILEELSPQYKAVLVLREFEDLSYLEIAEALQCSLGTVESRLFRARAQFRGILERRHPELLS